MLSKLKPRSAYDVMAALACFAALAGGTAYAANTIGSEDVINESLLSQDIKNREVGTSDLAIGAVFGTRIRDNAILSSHVVDNALTGADVNEATLNNRMELKGSGTVSEDSHTAFTGDTPYNVLLPIVGTITPNRTMTLNEFVVRGNSGVDPVTVTVQKNGADTSTTCVIPIGGGTCEVANTVTAEPRTSLTIKIDLVGTETRALTWHAELE